MGTAAKGNPWTWVGGSNRGKLSNTDDTVVSGIKPVVVVNYYQSLHKDDTPGEEESMFSSISDNEVKNIEENLDEGEYKYVTSNKKKTKKKKKQFQEKMNTVSKESKRRTNLFLLLVFLMMMTLLIVTLVTLLLQKMLLEKKLLKMHLAKMLHSFPLSQLMVI